MFFRSTTKREADKHGMKGWVKNLNDGRVEVVFEGEEETVNKMIEFCRNGPSYAKVKSIDVTWESFTGEFHDFRIRWRA